MIWENDRYKAPFDYIINQELIEYDLEKANINILRWKNVLDDKQYEYYKNLDRQRREISIGYLLKDSNLSKILQNGFKEARQLFFDMNKIEDIEVMYIDKDSITTINKPCYINKLNQYLNFREKKRYTSYYSLDIIDFLYYNDNMNEYYRLKNSNDIYMNKYHKDYMIDFLLSLFYTAQQQDFMSCIYMIKGFYRDYINHKLPIQFYREFNPRNKYAIKSDEYHNYYSEWLNYGTDISSIDIMYNINNIIRRLYRIYTRIYFSTKK